MTAARGDLALRNGVRIPRIGLGVFQAKPGESVRKAVASALECGYRHIDTAAVYGNELDVGEAVLSSGIPREEIFVTTKVWNQDQGYESTLRAFETSRKRLGFEQIDLYLVHWPLQGKRQDTWKALETLLADGKVRAIGVSNFLPRHLDELAQSAKVLPMVDQIEVSPFLQQREAREWCAGNGLTVEAYSPLTKGLRLKHPVLVEIALELGCSTAQLLIAWSLSNGLVVLPKSVHPERIRGNLEAGGLELPEAVLKRLDSLEEGLVTGWDPRSQM